MKTQENPGFALRRSLAILSILANVHGRTGFRKGIFRDGQFGHGIPVSALRASAARGRVMSWVRGTAEGVVLSVHACPRAAKSAICGLHGGALKVRLRAPPVDGAANLELVRFLAGELGVARNQVAIISGMAGRSKRIAVAGVTEAQARALAH